VGRRGPDGRLDAALVAEYDHGRRRDGRSRHRLIAVRQRRDACGKTTGALGNAREVTRLVGVEGHPDGQGESDRVRASAADRRVEGTRLFRAQGRHDRGCRAAGRAQHGNGRQPSVGWRCRAEHALPSSPPPVAGPYGDLRVSHAPVRGADIVADQRVDREAGQLPGTGPRERPCRGDPASGGGPVAEQ